MATSFQGDGPVGVLSTPTGPSPCVPLHGGSRWLLAARAGAETGTMTHCWRGQRNGLCEEAPMQYAGASHQGIDVVVLRADVDDAIAHHRRGEHPTSREEAPALGPGSGSESIHVTVLRADVD